MRQEHQAKSISDNLYSLSKSSILKEARVLCAAVVFAAHTASAALHACIQDYHPLGDYDNPKGVNLVYKHDQALLFFSMRSQAAHTASAALHAFKIFDFNSEALDCFLCAAWLVKILQGF